MPSVNTEFLLTEYETDFGNVLKDLPVKFEENPQLTDPQVIIPSLATRGGSNGCGGGGTLFQTRKVVMTFANGKSTSLPIPKLEDIEPVLRRALQVGDVRCVALVGEHWAGVPASYLGGTYSEGTIDNAIKPDKQGGTFSYTPSVGSALNIRRSFYTEPQPIYDAQLQCIGNLRQASACGSGSTGIKLRHFKGMIGTNDGKMIARKIFIPENTPDRIRGCGGAVQSTFNCLGYDGESVANAALAYAIT